MKQILILFLLLIQVFVFSQTRTVTTGGTTTNYVPKALGVSTIGNSLIFDNGTNVGIGTTSPGALLHVGSGSAFGGELFTITKSQNAETFMTILNPNNGSNSQAQIYLQCGSSNANLNLFVNSTTSHNGSFTGGINGTIGILANQGPMQLGTVSSSNLSLGTHNAEALRIDPNQNIISNPSEKVLSTSDSSGFFYIGNCAGTPTGTPLFQHPGCTPLMCDSVHKILYMFIAGTWWASAPGTLTGSGRPNYLANWGSANSLTSGFLKMVNTEELQDTNTQNSINFDYTGGTMRLNAPNGVTITGNQQFLLGTSNLVDGQMTFYRSANSSTTTIKAGATSGTVNLVWPASSGTIALTSQIPTDSSYAPGFGLKHSISTYTVTNYADTTCAKCPVTPYYVSQHGGADSSYTTGYGLKHSISGSTSTFKADTTSGTGEAKLATQFSAMTRFNWTTPEAFGAKGDGTTNDSAAVQQALNTHLPILLRSMYRVNEMSLPAGTHIFGNNDSTSGFVSTTNDTCLKIKGSNIILENFKMKGNAAGSKQKAISINCSAAFTNIFTNINVLGIYIDGFYTGLYAKNNGQTDQGGYVATANTIVRCHYGIDNDTAGAYNMYVGNNLYNNITGLRIVGGNNTYLSGKIVYNTTNVYIGNGFNNGHSILSGVTINHASLYSVFADNSTIGYDFENCIINSGSSGGRIYIDSCYSIKFDACDIVNDSIKVVHSTATQFDNCKIVNCPYVTQTSSLVSWTNCKYLNQSYGYTTPPTGLVDCGVSQQLIMSNDAGLYTELEMKNSNTSGGKYTNNLQTLQSRGSLLSPSASQQGDNLFDITTAGYDGSVYKSQAGLYFVVDSTVSSGIIPTSIYFLTSNTSANRTLNFCIGSDGSSSVGFNPKQGFQLNVNQPSIGNQMNVYNNSTTTKASINVSNSSLSENVRIQYCGSSFTPNGMQLAGTSQLLTVGTGNDLQIGCFGSNNVKFWINGTNYQEFDVNGNSVLNSTGSSLSTSATNGFTYIPNCAGTPTGTPAGSYTGATPEVWDNTNNISYHYNSGWKANVSTTATQTVTNKRITLRTSIVTQSATPTMDTDNGDIFTITGLAQAITSMTTNLSGTPVDGDMIEIRIEDNGTARAITWGAKFASSGNLTLPSTTAISTVLHVFFQYETIGSLDEWVLMGFS